MKSIQLKITPENKPLINAIADVLLANGGSVYGKFEPDNPNYTAFRVWSDKDFRTREGYNPGLCSCETPESAIAEIKRAFGVDLTSKLKSEKINTFAIMGVLGR